MASLSDIMCMCRERRSGMWELGGDTAIGCCVRKELSCCGSWWEPAVCLAWVLVRSKASAGWRDGGRRHSLALMNSWGDEGNMERKRRASLVPVKSVPVDADQHEGEPPRIGLRLFVCKECSPAPLSQGVEFCSSRDLLSSLFPPSSRLLPSSSSS